MERGSEEGDISLSKVLQMSFTSHSYSFNLKKFEEYRSFEEEFCLLVCLVSNLSENVDKREVLCEYTL